MPTPFSIETLSGQLDQANKAREQGRYNEAQDALNRIVGECEQHLDDAAVKSLYGRACQVYATCFSDRDLLADAERWALKAQAATAGMGGKEEGTSNILLADIHRKQGHYETSIVDFTAGIALLDPTSLQCANALGGRAHAKIVLGKIDEAIKDREQALRIALDLNNNVAIGIFRGDLAKDYFFAGRLGEADAMIQMALPYVDPDHPRCGSYSHKVLGDILLAQGKIEPAREAYKIAAATDNEKPENNNHHCIAMGLTGLGWLELRKGEFRSAKTHFEQALASVHEDKALKAEGQAGMAVALWGCGEKKESEVMLESATRQYAITTNLYAKGHVKAAQGAILRLQKNRAASQAMAESNEAFDKCAKPLVGLGDKLSIELSRSAAPGSQQLG